MRLQNSTYLQLTTKMLVFLFSSRNRILYTSEYKYIQLLHNLMQPNGYLLERFFLKKISN